MQIKRRRWVIMRDNCTEIFCGLARNYQFKPIDDIGDTAIKTYLSHNKAIASFKNSWMNAERENYEAVEVEEVIKTVDDEKQCSKCGKFYPPKAIAIDGSGICVNCMIAEVADRRNRGEN